MRIPVLALCCLLAVAPAAAKDIAVTAAPVPLDPNDPDRTTVGALEYVAGFVLDSTAPEAMIADAAGNLTIAEGALSGAIESRGWGWRARHKVWDTFAVERSDGFEPTSLALLPSPQSSVAQKVDHSLLLLLERRYTEADGPAARVSVLFPSVVSNRVASFTLATLRLPLSVDNFECLAVRPAVDGRAVIYVLSDDNQSDKQRTLLLQFRARLLPFQTRTQ